MLLRRHKQAQIIAPKEDVVLDFEKWTVEQLREHAQQNSINLGNSTSAAGIAKKIMSAKQD